MDPCTDLVTRERVVLTIHKLYLSLAEKCRAEVGVSDEDIAIAAALASLDIATTLTEGDKAEGIAWLRGALDLLEAGQLLMAETVQ